MEGEGREVKREEEGDGERRWRDGQRASDGDIRDRWRERGRERECERG